MSRRQYMICAITITIALSGVFAFSIAVGNSVLPVIAVVLGMSLTYFCRRRVEDVVQDERTYRIAEKSSMRTIQVLGPTTAVIGVVSLAMSENGYVRLAETGYVLLYFNIALLGLYMFFYGYYSRKYGK